MANHETTREGAVPPPKCKAILLCERSIVEKETEQISLIGLFEQLHAASIPGNIEPFTVFLLLTDGIVGHQYEITVEVQDLRNDIVLVKSDVLTLKWEDRLANMQLLVSVGSLHVEHEGSYNVVAFADRQEVDRLRFEVLAQESFEDGEL